MFGLKATEHTLLACDQFVDHSPLTHAILEEFDHQPIKLVSALTGATSQHYAALSSIVFEAAKQHDTFALSLIQTACALRRHEINVKQTYCAWPGFCGRDIGHRRDKNIRHA